MRTTLNLDDDVLMAIKERARREGRSAGEVLSELARRALTNQGRVAQGTETNTFHGFEPLPHRGPAVSNDLIDRLREEEGE
jgi:plasmid stability protein